MVNKQKRERRMKSMKRMKKGRNMRKISSLKLIIIEMKMTSVVMMTMTDMLLEHFEVCDIVIKLLEYKNRLFSLLLRIKI
jgi:hypothetical protein